jgi:hypothetical protein
MKNKMQILYYVACGMCAMPVYADEIKIQDPVTIDVSVQVHNSITVGLSDCPTEPDDSGVVCDDEVMPMQVLDYAAWREIKE